MIAGDSQKAKWMADIKAAMWLENFNPPGILFSKCSVVRVGAQIILQDPDMLETTFQQAVLQHAVLNNLVIHTGGALGALVAGGRVWLGC